MTIGTQTSDAGRIAQVAVGAVLVAAAAALGHFVYEFGQHRFLTLDEYQWGHLAWLVSEAQVPYRDFYEHHLPLGYLFHSLFIDSDAGFAEQTLLLRKIAFAHLVVGMGVLGFATWYARRDFCEAMLCVIVPTAFGFSLMTAIEFRGDNWSGFLLLGCVSLIELNQRRRHWALALIAGWMLGCAVFVTQKVVLLGGLAVGVMALVGMRERWRTRLPAQSLPHPWMFTAAAASVALAFVALGAHYGVIELAYQANVLDALEHEKLYPGFDAARYILPFLQHTGWTTIPIVGFALFYVIGGFRQFWTLPLLFALIGAVSVSAPYPYNFTYLSIVAVVCGVRGYCDAARWAAVRLNLPAAIRPLLYLVPLLTVPDQLGFLSGTTPNRNQLELLTMIERHSDADEVVIDSAGSALFRPHRSYYWYHGRAHVKMFDEYYQGAFVDDLRATRALFHIRTKRFKQLPAKPRYYLLSNYVRFHRDLYVLGFYTPRNPTNETKTLRWNIVRSGDYYVSLVKARPGLGQRSWTQTITFDGTPLSGSSIRLDEGWHEIKILPGAQRFRFSFLPPSKFGDVQDRKVTHTGGFEFRNADERLGESSERSENADLESD